MKHSTLISRRTDGLETITDKDTGQVFHVVRRDIKDGVETLVAVSSELSLQTTSVGVRDKYAFDNFYSGKMLTGLMKSKALNISESSVLGFLLENMSSGCKIQVSQSVISDSIGMDKSNVSRTIKGLKEKLLIADSVNPLSPSIQVLYIDPRLAYKGPRSRFESVAKRFGRLLRENSERNNPCK